MTESAEATQEAVSTKGSTEGGSLTELTFDNSFVRELPGDPESRNFRRQVERACYSPVAATAVSGPRLVAYSREVADLLGLAKGACDTQDFADIFAGNRLVSGMEAYAACYGGHQFGNWAGQLGDGRALTLGEVVHRGKRWELQLKGAGETPYSRMGDGRAVMRSSVREFLCSEAMHHLGVPTTRALSLVATGDPIVRDMFYDGNPKPEPGAVVCRVAPSFVRFGSFEIFTARRDHETLKTLADYVISTHFPHLGEPSPEVYLGWLEEVSQSTAAMIVEWMRVGFVHGVMNTDNMSILGLTIDYGPYGWLDNYDPDWTPNTTDAGGRRYRYGHQPQIALWNLARFAEAIHPLIGTVEPLQKILEACWANLQGDLQAMWMRKLGLEAGDSSEAGAPDEDQALVEGLHAILQGAETDMTIFFRRLAEVPVKSEAAEPTGDELQAILEESLYSPEEVTAQHREQTLAWLTGYRARLRAEGIPDAERRKQMNAANPKYVLRNYVAQLAIDKAEQGDGSIVRELLEVLRHPYDEQPDKEEYAAKRPEWARHRPGCSMLSCSS